MDEYTWRVRGGSGVLHAYQDHRQEPGRTRKNQEEPGTTENTQGPHTYSDRSLFSAWEVRSHPAAAASLSQPLPIRTLALSHCRTLLHSPPLSSSLLQSPPVSSTSTHTAMGPMCAKAPLPFVGGSRGIAETSRTDLSSPSSSSSPSARSARFALLNANLTLVLRD